MQIVVGADEARRTLLKRAPASETELGPSGRARNREVFGVELGAAEAVARIIRDVRNEGDAAVQRYAVAFDGAAPAQIEVPRDEISAALDGLSPEERQAIEFMVARVRHYHEGQMRRVLATYTEDGLGVQVRDIETVGVYAPGNTPAYPS